jgi:hypothetical protein
MTTKILIAAAALAVAASTTPTMARSVTSDPDATMHEQQKLGPNEVTTQLGNASITQRHGRSYGRVIVPSYGYYQAPAYRYEPVPLNDW